MSVINALLQAAYRMTQGDSSSARQRGGMCCARCGSEEELKRRNCCDVILCNSCSAAWRSATAANDFRCVICDNPIVCA